MSCQTTTSIISKESPLLSLPFPPTISASDIINKRKPCRFISKSPNAFLIYRKAFLDHLSLTNHNLRMTEVSKLVSNHWKNETEFVKDAYRKISQDVETELSEKRKDCVSYRVVWKNSKYNTTRKRNKCGKMGKAMKNKGNKFDAIQSITKFKPTANRGNIFYQFVPAFPNIEHNSKSSKKHEKEVISTSDHENFNEYPNYQASNYDLDCNQLNQLYTNFNNCNDFNDQFSESLINEQQEQLIYQNIPKNNTKLMNCKYGFFMYTSLFLRYQWGFSLIETFGFRLIKYSGFGIRLIKTLGIRFKQTLGIRLLKTLRIRLL
ncbi:6186_t:CDS:2 [Rhizophagus irregularis]|nr:6186_t:CDS:2 [Rhizophagus irregularis]